METPDPISLWRKSCLAKEVQAPPEARKKENKLAVKGSGLGGLIAVEPLHEEENSKPCGGSRGASRSGAGDTESIKI